MAGTPISTHSDLESVYGEGAAAVRDRYVALSKAHHARFGTKPEIFARAPGRVNLIGEHIDYEGYGVLPMAIHLDTIVGVSRGGADLTITNVEAHKYGDLTFSADPDQTVDVGKHNWGNYFLAAYKGVFETAAAKGLPRPDISGLNVTIQGTVPTGSGLSSSAAIVCAASVALMHVYGFDFTKEASLGEVSEFTARAERYVGVTSGGMDQAISMLGARGIAKLVEFDPVRAHDVPLPAGATFVICNSLAVSNKAESATGRYNLRVVECRLAAAVLAALLGERREAARAVRTLKQLEPVVAARYSGPKGSTAGAPLAAVHELLHPGTYSAAEVEEILDAPLASLFEGDASAALVLAAFRDFKLHDRAAHVYSEAARVPAFRDVCLGHGSADEKIAALGKLMDDSQASCRDLYECSCKELDQVVALAKANGAIGSRLTGAGWGGCTVSLVKDEDVDAFLRVLTEEYVRPLIAEGRLTEETLSDNIFASKPSSGAALLKLDL
ncbi:Galactokinase [Auxenochlorella protothecoides]|uniref:Galactokinase n=1 Tax=Auxenochlorella protothecoides TaxID=3075 RepID=A0A087SE50_AUXPR|nr:Galactokinase [Auxenochlorella protothecoides]KFM24004.1 Galactokinase [Auxenochlorella protothecoides]RMZ52925.1 hypothetical protein APUTEX25_001044 [Auxenochlorella protothecoides]|eukprot:RMZ52925.1 hypothetical protein APUTEX25_001044 [Auxenochlorella protothecoides]